MFFFVFNVFLAKIINNVLQWFRWIEILEQNPIYNTDEMDVVNNKA